MTQYFARVHFGKNFVKVTFLLNKLPKSWFDEIFFSTLWVCNSQCGKTRNSFSPKKKFRQINYLVIKHEYLRSCASRCLSLSSSSSFPGVLEIHRDTRAYILDLASRNFSLVKPLLSRNFCQKCVRVNLRNFHIVQLAFFFKKKLKIFREINSTKNVPFTKLLSEKCECKFLLYFVFTLLLRV